MTGNAYNSQSAVNPPPHTIWFPCAIKNWCPGWPVDTQVHHALQIGGTRTEQDPIIREPVAVTELRGWIRNFKPADCHCQDPDFNYDFEIDPVWASDIGMDLNDLFRAGSTEFNADNNTSADWGQCYVMQSGETSRCVTPFVHVEAVAAYDPSLESHGYNKNEGCNCGKDTFWPTRRINSDPPTHEAGRPLSDCNLPLQDGDYVRMVGSLVTDQDHGATGKFWTVWDNTGNPRSESNQTRHTELHPPDIVVRLPPRNREVTTKTILVSSDGILTAAIFPPRPRQGNEGLEFSVVSDDNASTIDGAIIQQNVQESIVGGKPALLLTVGTDHPRYKLTAKVWWGNCHWGQVKCDSGLCLPSGDMNCGSCGNVCGDNETCKNNVCVASGDGDPCPGAKDCGVDCNGNQVCAPKQKPCPDFGSCLSVDTDEEARERRRK